VSGGDTGGRLVRPFALTGGRTEPSRSDFTLITLVTAVESESAPAEGLPPEHLAILRRCRTPTAVAEIAAHLDLPVSVIAIMLCDLLEDGKITARPPLQLRQTPDPSLLQKVRDGLGRL
jgi:hypothetical protein